MGLFTNKCPTCKKRIKKSFNVCPYCGTVLKDDVKLNNKADFNVEEKNRLQPLFKVRKFQLMTVESQKLLLKFHDSFVNKGYQLISINDNTAVYFDQNKLFLKVHSSKDENTFSVSYRFSRTGYFIVDQKSSFDKYTHLLKDIPDRNELQFSEEKHNTKASINEDLADSFVGRFLFEHSSLIEVYNRFHTLLLENDFVMRTVGRELQYENGSFLVTVFAVKKYQDRVLYKHSYSGAKPKGIFTDTDVDYRIKQIIEALETHLTMDKDPVISFERKEEKTIFEVSFDNLEVILHQFKADFSNLTSSQEYVNEFILNDISAKYSRAFEFCNEKDNIEEIKNRGEKGALDIELARYFYSNYRSLKIENFEKYNEVYLSNKLIEEKEYLDKILYDIDPVISLDDDQRKAVVSDDSNCLLIAGAGAGKTTTMAAKVKYLVEKRNVDPNEIVVISYTNMAINELRDRINDKLKIPCKICTFHAFGYEILRKSDQVPAEILYSSYNYVYECIKNKIYDNDRLLRNIILFFGYYFDIDEEFANFKSLNQYHQYKSEKIYETIKSNLGIYNAQVMDSRSKKNKTITGEYLRSVQEVQIANFLYLNQLDYEYEPVYPHPIPGAKKKYTPDFCIKQGELRVYLEHFGISDEGKNPLYTEENLKVYIKNINDKIRLHKQFHTPLITTYSSYKDHRPLLDHLKEELKNKGFTLVERDSKEVYQALVNSDSDKYCIHFVIFLMNFISRFKGSGYQLEDFEKLKAEANNVRTKLFLDICKEVYIYYDDELRRHNQIDFEDMINLAEKMLKDIADSKRQLPYKYIIIDEFQDIARQRFNLAKKLSEVTNSKIIAVGDDWQSIFAFAGSDITLFTRFLEIVGCGTERQITHTYRNSQELIDIAGNFVQKNPMQITKRLLSPKKLENPIVILSYDNESRKAKEKGAAASKAVGEIVKEFGEQKSILLLGRYGFEAKHLVNSGFFEMKNERQIYCVAYPKVRVDFMTVHSSKGLGYDNVILLNMEDGKYGFPSQIEDDPILKLVTYEDHTVEFAEERRLLYVALTRTKNRVYMLAPKSHCSRFLVELIKEHGVKAPLDIDLSIHDKIKMKCPRCGMPLKREYNKNYGLLLYICTNEPEICDFMTNNVQGMGEIHKCSRCKDGYMIVKQKKNNNGFIFGCTNFQSGSKESCNAVENFEK
ncbi:MAG: UvrD-helicase domain-containing protein [Erysipelotrichaceae bacterium]|nr:UvrD-helicase domain-containing protein [Erysipelotrichaceae bacterium]